MLEEFFSFLSGLFSVGLFLRGLPATHNAVFLYRRLARLTVYKYSIKGFGCVNLSIFQKDQIGPRDKEHLKWLLIASANGVIGKPCLSHEIRVIKVTPIEHHRFFQSSLYGIEVWAAEFIPFRHYQQAVSFTQVV